MSASPLPLEIRPLSQVERVVDTFIAPSKTFADIRRNASWWLPIILVAIFSCTFAYVVLHKIGLPTLIDSTLHSNASLEERMSQMSPAQAAQMRAMISKQFQFMYVAPVLLVVFGLAISGIFLATANFGFGGRASYKQMLAVWFYGTLPLAFISLLTIVTIFAGMTSDNFDIKNPVGTNVGYYLISTGAPRWLETILSSVDVFTIWSAVLLTIGVSTVAGIKRGSAAAVVFGWCGCSGS